MFTNKIGSDMANGAISERELVLSLNRSVDAFNQGLPEFFDEFAADATIYTTGSPEPIKGREAYRQLFQELLSKKDRQKTILDRKIQLVGDKAVVTQNAKITEGDMSVPVFQTLIYGQTIEGLKVQHSETSMLTETRSSTDANSVDVVREVIGTSTPVVGVAQ